MDARSISALLFAKYPSNTQRFTEKGQKTFAPDGRSGGTISCLTEDGGTTVWHAIVFARIEAARIRSPTRRLVSGVRDAKQCLL
jgi:hypothetical protein